MFWKRKKTVRVVFVDSATGAPFANTDSPPELLPDSFEAHTTVNVEGQEWEVLSSTPITRAEYVKLGELRLNVRKLNVQKVPLDKILYSLPTICDGIPGIAEGSTKVSKKVLELHEDDWRQVELVSAVYEQELRACLAKIERIYAEERTGRGFKTLYVRTELAAPIAQGGPTLEGLRAALAPTPAVYDGVSYRQVAGIIDDAFAFQTAAALGVYGIQRNSSVAVVGLVDGQVTEGFESDARRLAALLRTHGLLLVDWCRVQVVDGVDEKVAAYLDPRATGST